MALCCAEEVWRAMTSYPKVEHLGSRNTYGVFDGPVVVQEKIDGSQFRWIREGDNVRYFSRSREIVLDENRGVDGLFGPAIRHLGLRREAMVEGLLYCGETLAKAKHNILAYDRVPRGHVVLFDVFRSDWHYYTSQDKLNNFADALEIEPVAQLHSGELSALSAQNFLEGPSQLGGIREGIVIKNYSKGIFAKLVADRFKEVKGVKPTHVPKEGFDAQIATLVNRYAGEARMEKALQHLRERGEWDCSPKDIGPLIKEIQSDFDAECADDIKELLWELVKPEMMKLIGPKMAMWYKERLAKVGSATEDAGMLRGMENMTS